MSIKESILSIDVGTTILKVGVFDLNLKCLAFNESSYYLSTPDSNSVEIDPGKWWEGFKKAIKDIKFPLEDISIITLSTNTPGLTTMDINGEPLLPSILHLDRRSIKQAKFISNAIGEDALLKYTGNLPAPGGSSACSILWIKENYPDIYNKAFIFGHTNTFFAKRLTGNWGVDPSNASLSNIYNTTTYGDWNKDIIDALKIDAGKLPPIVYSDKVVGKLEKEIAKDLGLRSGIPVLMGGNDAICATLGADVIREGQMLDVIGTTELFNVCTKKPIYSVKFNLRAHVIKNKWCTVFILNTAGKSIEWIYNNFYKDMKKDYFYNKYLPKLSKKKIKYLPKFRPYFCGDRYSLKDKGASFSRIKLNMDRDDLLLSAIEGIVKNTKGYIDSIAMNIALDKVIYIAGGGIGAFIDFKKRIFSDFDFKIVESSSLLGAARLAKMYISNNF